MQHRTKSMLLFVALSTAVSVIVLYFGHALFTKAYVQHHLEAESEIMLAQLEEHVTQGEKLLLTVPDKVDGVCNDAAMDTLKREAFSHSFVRSLNKRMANGAYCSDLHRDLRFDDLHWNDIRDNYSIGIGKNHFTNTYELLLRHVDERGIWVADLEPVSVPRGVCENCVLVGVRTQGATMMFTYGEQEGKNAPKAFDVVKQSEHFPFAIELVATEQYLNAFREHSRNAVLITGMVIGLLIGSVLTWVVNLRNSFGAVVSRAIDNREFVAWYQPIVDCTTGEIAGCEALVRWQKPDGSLMPPGQFIPFVEESGQIIPITLQLLEQLEEDIVTLGWKGTGKFMSLNLVSEHLESSDFANAMLKLLDNGRIDAANISLEITERKKIDKLKEARGFLEPLFERGVSLKLDDAGTGYGGFSYVQELGIDTLKIDKLFVDTIGTEDVKRPVLDAIIAFAEKSKLKMIAEGVEEESQLTYLKEQGVHLIQGYYYSPPLSVDKLRDWIKNLAA